MTNCQSQNLRVTHGVDKRLAAVLGPEVRVVELARVPHDLVHKLRQPHGVARRARACRLEASGFRVGDMTLVVRGVNVLAVPASFFMSMFAQG